MSTNWLEEWNFQTNPKSNLFKSIFIPFVRWRVNLQGKQKIIFLNRSLKQKGGQIDHIIPPPILYK